MPNQIITPEDLASAIRTRRKAHKITQKQVAFAAGTGIRFVIDLEKAKPTCELAKTLRVLRVLGIDIFLKPRHEK